MEGATGAQLQDLMRRLAEGDRSAFSPMYAQAYPLLRRFTARFLGDGADAEDAAQQALLNVFSRAAAFDPSRDALAWMLGIAAWECRTLCRRRQRRREAPVTAAVLEAPHGAPSPEEGTILRDLEAAAREVLGGLRVQDAEAIALAARGGGAERLGLHPAAFRKRLQRALDRARTLWRTTHGDG